MFSGIVEGTGIVRKILDFPGGGKKIFVEAPLKVRLGDSISVNGACLTVCNFKNGILEFDLSPETLRITNLRYCSVGDHVNLERSIKFNGTISGHIVQGHILTTTKILSIKHKGNFHDFEFEMKNDIKPYIIYKGFVALDGISLTVSRISKKSFSVHVIPLTYKVTNLKFRKENDQVNFEPDIFIRTIVDRLQEMTKNKRIFRSLMSRVK